MPRPHPVRFEVNIAPFAPPPQNDKKLRGSVDIFFSVPVRACMLTLEPYCWEALLGWTCLQEAEVPWSIFSYIHYITRFIQAAYQ